MGQSGSIFPLSCVVWSWLQTGAGVFAQGSRMMAFKQTQCAAPAAPQCSLVCVVLLLWQPTASPVVSTCCLSQSINFYIMSYFIMVSAHFGFLSPGTQLHWWNVPSWGVGNGISFYFCGVNNSGRGTAKGWLELLLLMLLKLLLPSLFQSKMVQFRLTVKIRE